MMGISAGKEGGGGSGVTNGIINFGESQSVHPTAIPGEPQFYIFPDTAVTPTPHPFLVDETGVYQIVREPSAGVGTGEVLVKQADGSYAAADVNIHSNLSGIGVDSTSHPLLYVQGKSTDIDTMAEHSGHPDSVVACASGEENRRIIRTHGGILWIAESCTGVVGTSTWKPINEYLLLSHQANSTANNLGCIDLWGTSVTFADCNASRISRGMPIPVNSIVTRIVVVDWVATDNGANCSLHGWKATAAATLTANPNHTSPPAGYSLLFNSLTAFNGTANSTFVTNAVWDSSAVTASWTFAPGDFLQLELDDANCAGAAAGAFSFGVYIYGVQIN